LLFIGNQHAHTCSINSGGLQYRKSL